MRAKLKKMLGCNACKDQENVGMSCVQSTKNITKIITSVS